MRNTFFKNLFLSFLLCIGLASNNYAADKLPLLDPGPGLKGPDTDKNGVRDDIDLWIKNQPYSEAQKKAALQSARALQNSLSVKTTDLALVRAANLAIFRAVGCVHRQFPMSQQEQSSHTVLKTLQKYTMNTKDRTAAYLKFNEALNGSDTELPKGNTCD